MNLRLIAQEYCSDEEAEETTRIERKRLLIDPQSLPDSLQTPDTTPYCGGYVSKRRKTTTKDSQDISTNYSTLSSHLLETQHNTLTSHDRHKPFVWKAHTKPILNIDWHPTIHHLLLSSSLDGHLKIWNTTSTNNCVSQLSFDSPLQVAKWADISHVLTGGMANTVHYIDMTTLGTITKSGVLEGSVTALSVHPTDHNMYVTGDTCKSVKLWDVRCGSKLVNLYSGAGGQILDIAFINNGHELVASSDIVRKNASSQMLLVWEYSSTLVQSRQIYCEPYTCPCIRSHLHESIFMAQSNADYIVLFSSKLPYKMNKWKRFESGHTVGGYRTQFDISCDGASVVSASSDGGVSVYDWKSTRLKKKHYICPGSSRSPSIAVRCHPVSPLSVACSYWDGSITVGNL